MSPSREESARTRLPIAFRAAHSRFPINPVPPVTRTVSCILCEESWTARCELANRLHVIVGTADFQGGALIRVRRNRYLTTEHFAHQVAKTNPPAASKTIE